MGGVDAAVEDGDADAFADGGVPGAVRRAAGDVVAVAACLADGPALGGVVVGVGGGRSRAWEWEQGRLVRRGVADAGVGGDMGAEMEGIGSADGRIDVCWTQQETVG